MSVEQRLAQLEANQQAIIKWINQKQPTLRLIIRQLNKDTADIKQLKVQSQPPAAEPIIEQPTEESEVEK